MSLIEMMIVLLLFIVVIGLLNEKVFHLQSDIALLLLSLLVSIVLVVIRSLGIFPEVGEFITKLGDFEFEEYLMDYVLCFMLFAGSSKVNMGKFKTNIKAISLLALLTTVVSSFIYGGLFYLGGQLIGLPMDIWTCVMLGCIVSPTDPIAATGILNKLGLSKNVTSVIESESLFNDGTGVALFVFVKSIVSRSGSSNFLTVMAKEVLGAVVVAFVVSWCFGKCMELTKDPVRQIFISILDVALSYAICERFGFSGVIASVICGMYFASVTDRLKNQRAVYDRAELYNDFWEVLDYIFNAILFVMIGLTIIDARLSGYAMYLIPLAIASVIISRFLGVMLSGIITGRKKIPSSYSMGEFVVLMTWSALKGGLSLALAFSTAAFLDDQVYQIVVTVTYITIFFTVVVQGLSVSKGYMIIERHKARRIRRESLKNMVRK
ncbi:MAG: sodium:proton antiporter [Lachnospiraceae bacterium]|nr:sodium:proton antiporter [Lachnospiraceae bacterium]